MADEDWSRDFGRAVAQFLNGEAIRERGPRGERDLSASFLLCFNAHPDWTEFTMPPAEYAKQWRMVIDTSKPGLEAPAPVDASSSFWVPDRSLIVLQRDE